MKFAINQMLNSRLINKRVRVTQSDHADFLNQPPITRSPMSWIQRLQQRNPNSLRVANSKQGEGSSGVHCRNGIISWIGRVRSILDTFNKNRVYRHCKAVDQNRIAHAKMWQLTKADDFVVQEHCATPAERHSSCALGQSVEQQCY